MTQLSSAETWRWKSPSIGYDATRLMLGSILIAAAFLKGHQLATEPVAGTGLLNSRWFLVMLTELEFLFGLWLLTGLYPQVTRPLAVLLFTSFAAVAFSKIWAGEANCGCLGRLRINPWYMLIFDGVAVCALLLFQPRSQAAPSARSRRWRLGSATAIAVVIGVPGGWAMSIYRPASISNSGDFVGDSSFVILEPEKWIGSAFPLLKHIDIGDRLAEGRWLVVFYHHDCPDCQKALPKLASLAQEIAGTAPPPLEIALIDVPPHGPQPPLSRHATSELHFGKLSASREWFVVTPTAVLIIEGNVQRNWERAVPIELEAILATE